MTVTLRFLARGTKREGKVSPGHVWPCGFIVIDNDSVHAKKPIKRAFNSLAEIPLALERLLIDGGITVHRARRMEEYIE